MKLSLFILAVLIAAVCAFSAAPAAAAFYRYIDKDGGEHITNDFNQIPEEYRKQFYDKSEPKKPQTVLNAEAELEASTASARARRAQAEAASENDGPRTILQRIISLVDRHNARLALQIAAAVTAIIAVFIVGTRLGSAFGHKKLTALIMLALSGLIIVYLITTNLRHISKNFKDVTGKVEKLQKKLNAGDENIRKGIGESNEQKNPGEEPH